MIKRKVLAELLHRLQGESSFIQVLSGPRQVGKTTLAEQAMADLKIPHHYAAADAPGTPNIHWIEQQWQAARLEHKRLRKPLLLVLDEVQKIPRWSESVKKLWDEDRRTRLPIKVLLLGSAPLLMQQGLQESLAGRFETLAVTHWTYPEMQAAFDWTLPQYCYFGGYPGAAPLIAEEARWKHYVLNSLIEPTLSKDVLLMQRIDKPALLRQVFQLGCEYSGSILSYQKMLGQLAQAGNTTTLAHYLTLLNAAGMLTGLQKYTPKTHRQRASSPKLQVYNNALMTAQSAFGFQTSQADLPRWGHLVESMVGAHLQNQIQGTDAQLFYWNEGQHEVDYVLQQGSHVLGIEVKSGRVHGSAGMAHFKKQFPQAKLILVGPSGVPLETFLTLSIVDIFSV